MLPKHDPNSIMPRRIVNVTFKVDDLVVMYAAARALRQGTSLNALINFFLEGYSGVQPPSWARPRRRRARRGLPAFVIDATLVRKSPTFRRRMEEGAVKRP